jgi:hypothetical protein
VPIYKLKTGRLPVFSLSYDTIVLYHVLLPKSSILQIFFKVSENNGLLPCRTGVEAIDKRGKIGYNYFWEFVKNCYGIDVAAKT